MTLTYLRRNHAQHELAEYYDTSQPTISRTITTWTPRLAEVLGTFVPTVDHLDPHEQLIIDGTLLPTWSWADLPELYSGKHHTTGVNVQVACTLGGRLAWVSDPLPGRTHDTNAVRQSGILDHLADPAIGDKGYIGTGMITPIRKPPKRALHADDKAINWQVNSIRATIERVIANLKTWRILHTDYRRPYKTLATTLTAILALEFYFNWS